MPRAPAGSRALVADAQLPQNRASDDLEPCPLSTLRKRNARVPRKIYSRASGWNRAAHAVDLGCGPGNSTELLVERFAGAVVTGTDTSEAMLESARKRLPQCHFELSDVSSWQAKDAPDSDLRQCSPAMGSGP